MKRLENKVALITGAAQGMGASEAHIFGEHGASLIITDVNVQLLDKVKADLEAKGIKVLALEHDVSSEKAWEKVALEAEKTYGKVDVLVNNAGIYDMAGVEGTSMEIWNRVLAIDLTGSWLGMKYIVPLMRKAKGGSIVNISSIYGIIGSGTSAAYQSAKGGVRLLSKTAAIEFAKDNIRVNSIHPGAIDTPMANSLSVEAIKGILGLIPLQRMGTPEEVAKGALFLACDDSSYVTGTELVIDGGWTTQ